MARRRTGKGIRHPAATLAGVVAAMMPAAAALLPSPALAHASDRGHILLLPTGHYLAGGAMAVALTFLVLVLTPPRALERPFGRRLAIGSLPRGSRLALSGLSFACLAVLVAAGFLGSGDPLTNPLPLAVWAMFWVGLTLAQGVLGDLWRFVDPWYAPWRALGRLSGRRLERASLPGRLGYWPAFLQFFAFAWFELVHPAPDDPETLAWAVSVYFLVNLAAMAVFGHEAWSRQGECLSAFLRMVARLGVVEGRPQGGRVGLFLCLPGAKLVGAPPLPASGALFLLLALSSVSFDGLMRTFFWLGLIGVNPLEFPGRSAVTASSTVGLAAAFALLAAAFFLAVALGGRLAGGRGGLGAAAGVLVWSIVPIAVAYHAAHYLPSLAVDAQYALAALADPFGTAHLDVHAGVLMGADRAWLMWNLQAGIIVGGHLLAVLVGHVAAFRLYGRAAAARSQLPLALLMIAYTVLGLWLLAAPAA